MQESPFKKLTAQIQQAFNPKPPITNLVFKGGGVRGVAYLGALQVLDEHDLLNDLKRVGGTSAGSLTALMLSMRLSVREIKDTIAAIDFPSMAQEIDNHDQLGIVKNIVPETANLQRFRTRFGWYANQRMHKTIEQIVAQGCRGNGRATFADFEEMGHRRLFIVASNISRYRSEVFSYKETPHVAVADAALMSSSIPIFFEAVRFDGTSIGQGDYYVDGGLYDNYPIHVFDRSEYADHRRYFKEGLNYETLGLFLYPLWQNRKAVNIPKRWNEFIELVISNLYHSHQVKSITTSIVEESRTILIDDCGIKATDFNITAGSEKFEKLLQSGCDATREFLIKRRYIQPDSA